MNESGPRPSLVVLAGLVLGLLLGFAYSWFSLPVPVKTVTPGGLDAAGKDHYRAMIALAYSASGDRTRAEERLRALGEDRLPAVLDAQAQSALQGGQISEAQALAGLAAALRTPAGFVPTASNLSAAQTATAPAASPTIAATRAPAAFTPVPSITPPASRGLVFALASSETVCDPALPPGLLQVYVVDVRGRQLPGVRVQVSGDGGQTDVFYTGLAPDMGAGYADFLMAPQVTYSLVVGDAGEPAGGLSIPQCTGADGTNTMGGIRTRFRP